MKGHKSTAERSDFSNRLQASRQKLGLTQKALAQESGVSVRTIQRLESIKKQDMSENGPQPLASNLLQLAEALDVTAEFLLYGDEKMDNYMAKLKEELLTLTPEEICYYHEQTLTDKVLSHLKLTDEFIDEIHQEWNKSIRCYRPYVQDTIIRYCSNRPTEAVKQSKEEK